jgi:hypothetical protein
VLGRAVSTDVTGVGPALGFSAEVLVGVGGALSLFFEPEEVLPHPVFLFSPTHDPQLPIYALALLVTVCLLPF